MIEPRETIPIWEGRAESLPFGPERSALSACALGLRLAYNGDVDGASAQVGRAVSAAGRDTPESVNLADTIASLRDVAGSLASIKATQDQAYYVQNVVLSAEKENALKKDNELTEKVAAIAAAGGDASLAYGVATLGEKTAEVGSQVSGAILDVAGAFKGPIILAVLAIAGAIGVYAYAGSKV